MPVTLLPMVKFVIFSPNHGTSPHSKFVMAPAPLMMSKPSQVSFHVRFSPHVPEAVIHIAWIFVKSFQTLAAL